MRKLLLSMTLMIVEPSSAYSQTMPPPVAVKPAAPLADAALTARVAELLPLLRGEGDYDGFFAPSFRATVPKAQFEAIRGQLIAQNGPILGTGPLTPVTPFAGTMRIDFRDATATVQIAVDAAQPHQVTGLLISGITARTGSIDSIVQTFAALPGAAGFAVARLGEGDPQLLASHQPDRPLAIGSAFKLVILAELVRATNAGERRWDDLITLDATPLPAGAYFTKPAGTRLSLRELATAMISVSDNSATDILLHALGRDKVEAMMPALGIRELARNRPFLATLELFKLKGVAQGALARRYLALDERGRRALLAGEIAATPLFAIDSGLFKRGKPVMIDTLEWFESPGDLVRVMDWLRRNTEGAAGAEARAILAKNPGPASGVTDKWRYIGYKGGSEPGVINMTLLLQAKSGAWYVLTGGWNDSAQAVDETRFAALIGRAAELLANQP